MKPAFAVLLLPLLVALAGCTDAPKADSGQARADAATLSACRERSDEVYDRQHRDTIYSISSRDTPYSANYTPGVMDRGLPQRFGYDSMVRDCVRNTGTQTDRNAAAPSTTPTATPTTTPTTILKSTMAPATP